VLTNVIWPPVSPVSGAPVLRSGELTAEDWKAVTFIERPHCRSCGVPFDHPSYDDMDCPACLASPQAFGCARSVFVYDAASRPMVLSFKHAGRTDAVAAYGRWMARAGADALKDADALIPVPLHPSRLRKRRFNQSLLLAEAISNLTGVPVDAHALVRVRRTPTQGGLTAKGRARNVAGAFAVRERARAGLKSQRLVLIDDVFTTGATLSACVRALKRAGAVNVNAITLARVVKPVDPTT
jgi:ComF family protein